jgi:hypothetical protein
LRLVHLVTGQHAATIRDAVVGKLFGQIHRTDADAAAAASMNERSPCLFSSPLVEKTLVIEKIPRLDEWAFPSQTRDSGPAKSRRLEAAFTHRQYHPAPLRLIVMRTLWSGRSRNERFSLCTLVTFSSIRDDAVFTQPCFRPRCPEPSG